MNKKNRVIFLLIGYNLFMLMVGANIPAPLYDVYQHQLGFTSGTLTLIFAIYAIILIPSLLLFGQLSDQIGRKKLLIGGLFMSASGSVVFALAGNINLLFIARGLQGLATGMMNGTATATLAELHPQNRKTASLVATVAIAGGTAMGPILGGYLAQYGPFPLVLPYAIHFILLIPGVITIFIMNETVSVKATSHWRPHLPQVPRRIRSPFIIGAATAFTAWSVTALFMSLIPSYVSSLMGIHNLTMTGGVVFLMLGASVCTQLVCKHLMFQTSMISGLLLLIIGLAGILFAVPLQSIPLLIFSTVIAGSGQGLSYMGSVSLTNEIAPSNERANVISCLFVAIYLGVGLPVIGIGFGAEWIGLYHAILIFASFITVLSILLSILVITKMRRNVTAPISSSPLDQNPK